MGRWLFEAFWSTIWEILNWLAVLVTGAPLDGGLAVDPE